jgi:hypothetical protein
VANLLKRYKWRYWQHPGMNLPPVSVQNDKGERFEIAAEELPSQFNGQIQSWDLSFEGKARSTTSPDCAWPHWREAVRR